MRSGVSFRHLVSAIGLVLLDQAVKLLVEKEYANISYNTGGAFSVGQTIGFYRVISLVLTATAVYAYFLVPKKLKIPLVLIASGALSNQIDRFFRAGVLDYINPVFWPSFNIADSMIFVGVCLVAYDLLFKQDFV